MEDGGSLPSDVWNITKFSEDDDLTLYLANIRDVALKVIYIVIGTVGVLDNLFVVVVFIMFIKITDKVLLIVNRILQNVIFTQCFKKNPPSHRPYLPTITHF